MQDRGTGRSCEPGGREGQGGVSPVYYHYREMAIIMLNHCATARQDDVSHKNGLVLIFFLVETRLKLKKIEL